MILRLALIITRQAFDADYLDSKPFLKKRIFALINQPGKTEMIAQSDNQSSTMGA